MRYSYQAIADGEWLKLTTAFTSHLHKQHILIAEMQSKCSKLITRWAALGTMCKWLLNKRVQLLQYIQQK